VRSRTQGQGIGGQRGKKDRLKGRRVMRKGRGSQVNMVVSPAKKNLIKGTVREGYLQGKIFIRGHFRLELGGSTRDSYGKLRGPRRKN